jgi:TaqI-like C-terminal specificity domain/Eco57I restriction-modification methylase
MCRESLINYLASEFISKLESYEKLGDSQLDILGNTSKKGQLDLEAENLSDIPIPKKDIETLINYGELLGENDAAVEAKGKETNTYYYKLSKNIRINARLIDDKLADILVCDPAVGSGAFPVGMMHEIVTTRNLLSIFINDTSRSIYKFKRKCIEKSLYGVDIDSGAVEIAKLRLWLSLVVDEDDITNIKPLPNLDYKIICGNSLIGVQKDLLNAHLIDELEKLKPLHFNETNPTKKQEYKKKIDKLILQITNGHKDFDYEIYFSEVFHKKKGFDVVISNPPYRILTKNNIADSILKIYIRKYESIKVSNSKNIFTLFIEKSISLINQKSCLNLIVPEGLFQTRSYKECVEVMNKNGSVDSVVTFSNFVFENAVTGNIIFFYLKNQKVKTKRFHFDKNFIITKICEESDIVINKITAQKTVLIKDICFSFKGMVIKDRGEVVFESKTKGRNILLFGKSIKKWVINKKYYTNYSQLEIIGGTKKLEKHNIVPRILIRRTGDTLCCTYLSEPALTESTLYSCWSLSNDLSNKYLLSLLNSRLLDYFIKKKMITNKQAFPQILMTDFEELPIMTIDYKFQKPFIDIVDKILLGKQFPQTNTKQLEDQIDIMVYKLYNLTYEETAIIDPQIGNIISKIDYDK